MSDPKFTSFLKQKIIKDRVDPREAKRLSHFADPGNLEFKSLRNRDFPWQIATPNNKNTLPTLPRPHQNKSLSRSTPEEHRIAKRLSYEDIPQGLIQEMAAFVMADFNMAIPEYKGDSTSLSVFLKRCNTYHDSLSDATKPAFLKNLVYKLGVKHF